MSVPLNEVLPIEFSEALALTEKQPRHLLLGNGFSIDARRSFSYASLFQAAGQFSEPVADIFQRLNTQDFEEVLSSISARMAGSEQRAASNDHLKALDSEVRAGFIRAISNVHPESSVRLHEDEYRNCADFLEKFAGHRRGNFRGKIFTTNYDLMLYWVLVRDGRRLKCYDGHISPVNNHRFGVWDPEKVPHLWYLHGGLHLYEHNGQQRMLRYDGERRLVDQARERLSKGQFPVIVSEGTSEAKLARIKKSPYLQAARNAFASALNKTAALFTLGHGLSDRDDHFIRLVGRKRIETVFVGAWGGLDSPDGEAARRWAKIWWVMRNNQPQPVPLQVFVFDTSLVSAWRGPQ